MPTINNNKNLSPFCFIYDLPTTIQRQYWLIDGAGVAVMDEHDRGREFA